MNLAAWYEAEPIFLITAFSSTLLFLGLFMMSMFGGDNGNGDAPELELDTGDSHVSSDTAFKLFSLQSLLAFFMGLGWTGLSTRQEFGLPYLASIPLSVITGIVFMFFTAWLMAKVYGLRHEPQRTLQSAIGTYGKVYISLPKKGEGKGQVQVVVDEQLKTLNAISSGDSIKEFAEIEVVGLHDPSTLIVREKTK